MKKVKMKPRNTAIVLGIGAATGAVLSLIKFDIGLLVGSSAVIAGAGLIFSLRDQDNLNANIKDYEYFFNRAQDKFEVANYERGNIGLQQSIRAITN